MNSNNNENKVVYLRLDDIIPNRFQPREVFDETGLEELADSIREHGVIQPIIVRQMGDKYELIAGERRSKATAMAGLTTIPAIIRNMDDKESAKVSLLENLQRKNLSAIEEARTYKRILELDNMTQDDLAKTMGKSQPLIANKLRLLSLPEEVQDALIKNQISERHARSLLNVKNKKEQLQLLDKIRNERLTVRELDVEIKKMNEVSSIVSNNEIPSGNVYNNLNQPINNNNNSRANFSNMGLNDYQSSVNNNLYNNIPSYQPFNNQFQSNDQLNNNQFDYNNFDQDIYQNMQSNNDSYMNNSFENISSSNFNNINGDYSSLGSLFDGQSNNVNFQNNEYLQDNTDSKNIFISHIKEDELKSKENQFLPNFDDMPLVNNQFGDNNELSNNFDYLNQVGFNQDNSYDSSNQTNFDNMNLGNKSFDSNQSLENDNFNSNINNQQGVNNSMNSSIAYHANQGQLFNQPLNIIDIPNQNNYINSEDSFYSNNELNKEEQPSNYSLGNDLFNDTDSNNFDNPLDDPYENILFAKPVPIFKEDEKEEKESIEEVEVIGDAEESDYAMEKEEKYIKLDPVKTIFDTTGAINELKKTTDRIKQNNIKLDTEEIDYDDYYQIVIKIKKD